MLALPGVPVSLNISDCLEIWPLQQTGGSITTVPFYSWAFFQKLG